MKGGVLQRCGKRWFRRTKVEGAGGDRADRGAMLGETKDSKI